MPRKKNERGFARTKNYPHKLHPASYKKTGPDNIEYLTYTHSEMVEIDDKQYETISLTNNIEPEERGKSKSRVFPKVYIGKRSALGKEETKFRLTKKDKEIIEDLFNTLPREIVPYSSNSKKHKKK